MLHPHQSYLGKQLSSDKFSQPFFPSRKYKNNTLLKSIFKLEIPFPKVCSKEGSLPEDFSWKLIVSKQTETA